MTIEKLDPINIPQDFSATPLEDGSVLLEWQHDGLNTEGFRIDRATAGKSEFEQIDEIPAGSDSYNDTDVLGGTDYIYRIAGYSSSTESDFSDEATVTTLVVSVDGKTGLPIRYSLEQNYPNPFNPETIIQFALPERSYVNLSVYNILGKMEINLVNEEINSGIQKVFFDGSSLSSGIYFVKLEAESLQSNKNFKSAIKALLVK
jgi:hypothetical protein